MSGKKAIVVLLVGWFVIVGFMYSFAFFVNPGLKNDFKTIKTAYYADVIYESMKSAKQTNLDELFLVRNAPKREDFEEVERAVESLVKAGILVRVEDGHAWNGTAYKRWRLR